MAQTSVEMQLRLRQLLERQGDQGDMKLVKSRLTWRTSKPKNGQLIEVQLAVLFLRKQ